MILDMATIYHHVPNKDSQFAQIRDSLYILSVMNQCKVVDAFPETHALILGILQTPLRK